MLNPMYLRERRRYCQIDIVLDQAGIFSRVGS